MAKFQVSLSEDQAEELITSAYAIGEDNEQHQRSALYYLVSGALCCFNIQNMCKQILLNNKFDKDHNCFCGLNVYFAHINKIKNKSDWLPEKNEEVLKLYNQVLKSFKLYDKFCEEEFNSVIPNMKVQEGLLLKYEKLIEYLIKKENIREVLLRTDKEKHDSIVRFYMDLGKFSGDVVKFFLDHFIYKKK